MQLKSLLEGVKVLKTNLDLDVECMEISSSSHNVVKDGIFVALKGTCVDGNEFIKDALNMGVLGVITDDEVRCEKTIPYVLVDDARKTLSLMWSNYYSNPSKKMKLIAITGTNGKTTSAYLIYNILRVAKKSCGLISTIEVLINDEKIETDGGSEVVGKNSAMTTPDPKILYGLLDQMRRSNVEYVVLEASSHALEQNKLAGCDIEIGIFTNLSHEHLDFHKDMNSYFSAKEKLFKMCKLGIINADDKYGRILASRYKGRTLLYSCKEKADMNVSSIKKTGFGNKFVVNYENEHYNIESKLVGSFNIYNCLCAALCTDSLGISKKHIKDGIRNTRCVKGRLERYNKRCIYIDYAHTPDAMECVIKEIREIYPKKRLIVVFGCGGERDREKRSKMGRIATEMADVTIITSDNSRNESQKQIFEDILREVNQEKEYKVIENREKAIKFGVKAMKRNGVLLLLGKGHETYQIDANGKKAFDERVVLDKIFKK